MKFIKVVQQETQNILLINLANVDYVLVDRKTSSCTIRMSSQANINCAQDQVKGILDQISEYNRQIIEYLTLEPNTQDDF